MSGVMFSSSKKLGIVGGGQLGKMLLHTTQQWDIYTKVLDSDAEAPCKIGSNEFVHGSLQDFDTVYNFGKDCDVVTIEIEHVNVRALMKLEEQGVVVHPKPSSLAIIQDKGEQKMFFTANELPTADFSMFSNKEEVVSAITEKLIRFPFVQKTCKAGYDGKGVAILQHETDLHKLLDGACIVEDKIELHQEISVIGARNAHGEIVIYDAVAMDFHAETNMLDILICPVQISEDLLQQARQITTTLLQKLNISGLLAVEFLIDKNRKLYVNEVAPRAHNSGHQTIESSVTSQYEQHIRGVLNMPLGATDLIAPSVMVNLLGHPDYEGPVRYEGIEACLAQKGVHLHIYGKKTTKPFRKMGHATITHESIEEAKKIAIWVKQTLLIKSQR
jgi:5-(carboxyamino)imidazole ribonucleotide synthase